MITEIFRMLTVAVDPRQRFIAVFGVDILHHGVRVNVAGFAHHLQEGSGVLSTFRFPGMASPHLFLRAAAQGVVALLRQAAKTVIMHASLFLTNKSLFGQIEASIFHSINK